MNANDAKLFEEYRPLMVSIAYRMLGSMTDTEDIVQEAFLRYQRTPSETIESPKAFLTTVVTRLCLNQLQSAHNQRETYIGPWLPEPVLAEPDERFAPAKQSELHDSISIAFLALLEDLTPLERAVFLLREVFDYEYSEIGEMLGKEETACRQLFSRAKKHVAEHRPRFKPSPEAHRQILSRFIETVGTGEMDGLLQLLSEDVVMWADGGGKTRGAAIHPLHGREAVARFVMASTRFAPEPYHSTIEQVNGEECVVLRGMTNSILVVMSVGLDQNQIYELRVIGNPDKLKWIVASEAANDSDNEQEGKAQ